MIKKLLYFFLLLSVFMLPPGSAAMAEPTADFAKANALYKDKQYAKAAEVYEHLLEENYHSADLYFNLGNTWYRLKDWPKAVLNYERARRLSPLDEDILQNLSLARDKLPDQVEEVPDMAFVQRIDRLLLSLSAARWSAMALTALWLSLVCFGIFLFWTKISIRRPAYMAGLGLLGFYLLLISLAARRHSLETRDYALILPRESYIKSKPSELHKDAFKLHIGARVEIREEVGDWVFIRTDDGRTGWVEANEVERI